MHDLLTAQDILETCLKYAKKNNLETISKIVIELGNISDHGETIRPENLKFNLQILAKNTIAKNSKIIIKKIKGNSWLLKSIEGKKKE